MLRGSINGKIMGRLCNSVETAQINRRGPFFVGQVAGYKFYECPIDGDTVPLLVKDRLGRFGYSHWYELPSYGEME